MPYVPSQHTVSNKSYGPGQAVPTDARTYYYDTVNFVYRAYESLAEVIAYLNTSNFRKGQFSVIINFGGSLSAGVITGGSNREYWFKDGVADADLVEKPSAVGAFSTLTGTLWDGSEKRKSLAANESWTLNSLKATGVALVTGNGYNLSINGVTIALKPSGTTIIGFVRDGGDYYFDSNYTSTVSQPTLTTANRVAYWNNSSKVVSGGNVTAWDDVNGKNWASVTGALPVDGGADGVVFDGTKRMTITPNLTLTKPYSLYFRFKNLLDDSEILRTPNGANGYGYGFYFDTNNQLHHAPEDFNSLVAGPVVDVGGATAKVVCITRDTNNLVRFYVDGVQQGSGFNPNTAFAGNDFVIAGIEGEPGFELKGNLLAIALFSVAHNSTDAATNSPLV